MSWDRPGMSQMIGFILNYLWLQWQSGYSDTYPMSRGCHCKRGPLYPLGQVLAIFEPQRGFFLYTVQCTVMRPNMFNTTDEADHFEINSTVMKTKSRIDYHAKIDRGKRRYSVMQSVPEPDRYGALYTCTCTQSCISWWRSMFMGLWVVRAQV